MFLKKNKKKICLFLVFTLLWSLVAGPAEMIAQAADFDHNPGSLESGGLIFGNEDQEPAVAESVYDDFSPHDHLDYSVLEYEAEIPAPRFAELSNSQPLSSLEIGDVVVDRTWKWVHNEDGDPQTEAKPVNWIVVAVDHYEDMEPHVTLLSEELIRMRFFDDVRDGETEASQLPESSHWGNSGMVHPEHSLRLWLNSTGFHAGDGFYDTFSYTFKNALLTTRVPSRDWSTGEEYITEDQVFIPSLQELNIRSQDVNPAGRAFPYFEDATAHEKQAYIFRAAEGPINQRYWTRSPSSSQMHQVYAIADFTAIAIFGVSYYAWTDSGVRPVVNLAAETPVSLAPDGSGTYEIMSAAVEDYGMKMAPVPEAGAEFPRGVDDSDTGTVEDPFWMGETPLTYRVWYTIMQWALDNGYSFENLGREGSAGTVGVTPGATADKPVTTVNWRDVVIWLNAFSEYTGKDPVYRDGNNNVLRSSETDAHAPGDHPVDQALQTDNNGYRLPSSAEWEMAARWLGTTLPVEEPLASDVKWTTAGAQTYFWTPGSYASGATADINDTAATGAVAWYNDNADGAREVAGKQPNELGLYDMSGNVREWTFSGSASSRVVHNGNFAQGPADLQVGFTRQDTPDSAGFALGFRPVRSANRYSLTLNGDHISYFPQPGNFIENTEITITVGPEEQAHSQASVHFHVYSSIDDQSHFHVNTFTIGGEDRLSELLAGTENQYSFPITADTELMVAFSDTPPFAGGKGTRDEPFLVETAAHLDNIRNHAGAFFLQTEDIELGTAPWNQEKGWVPIGTQSEPFTGTFDGAGHTISGLRINLIDSIVGIDSINDIGLFGYAGSNHVFKNINLTEVDIFVAETDSIIPSRSAGALVGLSFAGTIMNCQAAGELDAVAQNVGGLVGGLTSGSIIDSAVAAEVTSDVPLIGYSRGLGGLAGSLENGRIKNSHATGMVTGNNNVGGLVGSFRAFWGYGIPTLTKSFGIIEKSYAVADVKGAFHVGGLVGTASQGGIGRLNIKNSFARGSLEANNNAGGLLGTLSGHSRGLRIRYNYAAVEMDTTRTSNVGGLIGSSSNGTGAGNSYWDAGTTAGAGGERTTFQMQQGLADSLVYDEQAQTVSSHHYFMYEGWCNYIWDFGGEDEYPSINPVLPLSLAGSGTEEDPYLVTTAEELWYMGYLDDYRVFFKQTAQIDLAGFDWKPVSLKGTFDGNGYEITGLVIDKPVLRNSGFVSHLQGTLKNVELVDVYVLGGIYASSNIGALAGYNAGIISGCSASGVVREGYLAGGLVGENGGTITDSHADVAVSGFVAGGLAGRGGWYGEQVNITRSYATGPVSLPPEFQEFLYYGGGAILGGLVGTGPGLHISESFATGEVTAAAGDAQDGFGITAGGLVGSFGGSIENSYATGAVSVEGNAVALVGGLAGNAHHWSDYHTITNSYSTGLVRAGDHPDSKAGGLVGEVPSDAVIGCYWDMESSGQTESGGGAGVAGRYSLEMTYPHDRHTTYIDWDFDQIWAEDSGSVRNNGYPVLQKLLPPAVSHGILTPAVSGTLVAGDLLHFRGLELSGPEAVYHWDFSDGRSFDLRSPGMVPFAEPGTYEVTYSAAAGETESLTDSRTYTVVENSGDIADLRIVTANAPSVAAVGGQVQLSYRARNSGDGPAEGSWTDKVYLSTGSHLDTNARLLASKQVSGPLEVGEEYHNTITVNLPVELEGSYHLILSVNDQWELLELHRLNNLEALPVAIELPQLSKGEDYTGAYGPGRVEQYYSMTASGIRNLFLDLKEAPPGLRVLVRYGALPTRTNYDYMLSGDRLVIPTAADGEWFVLVYGNMPEGGEYTLRYQLKNLYLTGSSPSHQATSDELELTLRGGDFSHLMEVALVGETGTVYNAELVEVDSFSHANAYFSADTIPAGTYTVRVSEGEHAAELPDALTYHTPPPLIFTPGEGPNLETRLILPGAVGYTALATIYVHYENTGTRPMPAPLMVVTAVQNDRQGALLTLDQTQQAGAIWSSSTEDFFTNSVQFMASGETPGILQPGESGRVPVYYAGWIPPHDTSTPPIEWYLGTVEEDNTTEVDWEAMKAGMRPELASEEAWEVVWDNFTSLAGDTWGDYVSMLNRNARYLNRQGLDVADLNSLVNFAIRQAEGLSPVPLLAGGPEAAVEAPGIPLFFERLFIDQIYNRFETGPLGQGWVHTWQVQLKERDDQSVVIYSGEGSPRVFRPDRRFTGRFLAQPGDEASLQRDGDDFRLTERDGTVHLFDEEGVLQYVEDSSGNRITCSYEDELLTKLEHSSGQFLEFTYDGDGKIVSLTDSLGRTTSYEYSGEYLTAVTGYEGLTTSYTYNTGPGAAQHTLASIELPDGTTRDFSYDARGRLASAARNGQEEKITYSYDGGLVEATNLLDETSRIYYDHRARMIKMVNPLGEGIQMEYDNLDNLLSATDPRGVSTTFEYDRRSNLVKVTDPLRQTTSFSYRFTDIAPRFITDAAGHSTEYSFDRQGNLQEIQYRDGSRESWSYDAQGNYTSWNNRSGENISYSYDAYSRLTAMTYPDGTQATYKYDQRGNLLEAENQEGKISFTYDQQDNLIRVDYPQGGWLKFSYDDHGRRSSSEDQSGAKVQYSYDGLGRLQSLSDTEGLIVSYEYDQLGRLAKKTLGNDLSTTYEYDAAGRLLRLVNRAPGKELISSFEYTYNRRGQRISEQTGYGTWLYYYDSGGRLIRAELNSSDQEIESVVLTYEYDALGNRVSKAVDGQSETYSSNLMNQYTTIGDRTYEYDRSGNLVSETDDSGNITYYSYDYENRLVTVTGGANDDSSHYSYDALGNRVKVEENGTTTHYVFDPIASGDLVGAYDSQGELLSSYTHGLGLVRSWSQDTGTSYYSFDPLGNTSELTGPDGAVQHRYASRPFGYNILSEGNITNPFQFMGEYGVVTDSTGLLHARARSYSPELGRFIMPDPTGYEGSGTNLYTYAANQPTMFVDPGGEIVFLAAIPLAAKGAALLTKCAAAVKTVAAAGPAVKAAAASSAKYAGAKYTAGKAAVAAKYATAKGAVCSKGLAAAAKAKRTATSAHALMLANPETFNFAKSFIEKVVDFNDGAVPNPTPGGTAGAVAGSAALAAWDWLFSGSERGPNLPVPMHEFDDILDLEDPDDDSDHDENGDDDNGNGAGGSGGSGRSGGRTNVWGSFDPNQKLSVSGYGDDNYVAAGALLNYHIDFENLDSATAPAQVVTVRDPLSDHLDLSTFELTEVGFGDIVVPVPAGLQHFETVVDYQYEDEEYDFEVQVHVEIWLEDGTVYANFITYDPETWMPPQDVSIGFLPPEDETGRGQGYFSYLVYPREDLPSGTEIRNIAQIQFDFDMIIATNQEDPEDPDSASPDLEALVTIDSIPPTSSVEPLPEVTTSREFTVSWSGEDDENGSGVGSYNIYVKEDDEEWVLWKERATGTSATFTGENETTYSFFSVAVDNVGYREVKPPVIEATTFIDATSETTYLSKELLPGWNLLSVPFKLQEEKDTLGQVIQDMDMVELVYMYDSETALEWDVADDMAVRWTQPAAEKELTPMDAMFIKVSGATEARLYPYTDFSGPYTRKLHEGWNLFGPALQMEEKDFRLEAKYVLASLIHPDHGHNIYSQVLSIPMGNQDYWSYVPGMPESPFMEAASAYWIYMVREGNLAGHSMTLPEQYGTTSFALQDTEGTPELPAAFSGTVQDEQGNPVSSGRIEIIVDGVVRAAKTFNDGEFGLSLSERMLVEEYYLRNPDNISFRVNGYAAELEEDLDWSQASGSLYQVNILVDTQIVEEISFLAVSVRDSSTVELLFSGSLLEDLTAEQVEALRAAVLLKRDGQEYTSLQPEDELAVRGDTIVLTLAEPLGQENRIHIEAGAITAADGELLHQPVETAVFSAQPVDECFIATAAFGSKLDPGVALLRQYRDARLLTNRPGQVFVSLYYSISPGIAAQIAGSSILKGMVRILLLPLLAGAYLLLHQWLLFMLILCTCAFIYLRKRQGKPTDKVVPY